MQLNIMRFMNFKKRVSKEILETATCPDDILNNLSFVGEFKVPRSKDMTKFVKDVFSLKKEFDGYSFTKQNVADILLCILTKSKSKDHDNISNIYIYMSHIMKLKEK